MIKFKAFTGIDISKKTFDAALILAETGTVYHRCFKQPKEGYMAFIKWLESYGITLKDTLVCMEHTGLYTKGIIHFLISLKAHLWVKMAIKIKRSMGLQRGTNDKASSITVAEYAMHFTDRAKLWDPADTKLSRLRDMIAQRDRIVNAIKQLTVPIEEVKQCGAAKEARDLEGLQQPAIKNLIRLVKLLEWLLMQSNAAITG